MIRFLRSVGGVAAMTALALVRAKAVWAVAALLAACVVGLPFVIAGDGTPEGACRILISYTLGSGFFLLGLTTLMVSCGLFAEEIDSSRLQLEWVKPVRVAALWLGKWLAVLGLGTVLTALMLAGAYAQLWARLGRNPSWQPRAALASRHVTRPILPPVEEEAKTFYREMQKKGELPKGVTKRQLLRALAERASDRYDVINPGAEVPWRFHLAKPVPPGGKLTVRIRFDTEFSTRAAVAGTCRLRAEGGSGAEVDVELNDLTQSEIEFDVDTRLFGLTKDGRNVAAPAQGWQDFQLSFRHTGNASKASGLMLRPRKDVMLLTPAWPFEANLILAGLMEIGILAALAALGLAFGACFSMPVALFASILVLILTMVSRSIVQVISLEDEKETRNKIGIAVVRGMATLTRGADARGTLTALTRGEAIEPRSIWEAWVSDIALIPALLALLSVLALSRREMAE